jgi:hypothetical protein
LLTPFIPSGHSDQLTKYGIDQRRARRFFGFDGVSAAVQKLTVSRFAAAATRPRAEPATAFAPLSHMLRNGFFFSHGFLMSVPPNHGSSW